MITNNSNKILVADDEARNVRILEAMLTPRNYQVIGAADGLATLEKAALENPDLILLDIMMPKIDGFEVCRQLKANPATQDIPVIFITARSDLDSLVAGFEVGGVDYITKPFYKDELLSRVRTHIDLQRSQKDLQRKTEELSQANDHLVEMDQTKTLFLNMAAHDIRTPITAIIGFAKIIRKKLGGILDPETDSAHRMRASAQVMHDIDIIISEGERLTNLINDLLDLAKLESGKFELRTEALEITDLFAQALSATAVLFESKRQTIRQDVETNLPRVVADPSRILQVLVNLLSNAVKFTPEGGRVVCRARQATTGNRDFVEVLVENTGSGIPQDRLDKVFDRFCQFEEGNSPGHSTGLGLSICKMLIDLHGGWMGCRSEPGQNCTFFFTLPAANEARVLAHSQTGQ